VRFGEQSEQVIALQTMQGRVGLGDRPMKVSIAFPKGKEGQVTRTEDGIEGAGGGQEQTAEQTQADYTAQWEQYNQYWSQYAAWQQWYAAQAQAQAAQPPLPPNNPTDAGSNATSEAPAEKLKVFKKRNIFDGNSKEVVQNKVKVDYDALNEEYLAASEELYDSIAESSRFDE